MVQPSKLLIRTVRTDKQDVTLCCCVRDPVPRSLPQLKTGFQHIVLHMTEIVIMGQ